MRFSPDGWNAQVEDTLGTAARTLEVRVRRAGLPPEAPGQQPARVVFAAAAAERAELEELVRGLDARPEEDGTGLVALTLAPGFLEERAAASTLARCLLQAIRNARAPRGPARVMAVLNVTPDSFSDGGRFHGAEEAIAVGLKLLEAGADILDVGGESTRPGADPVSCEVELERVVPVIRALARDGRAALSVDTRKARVAAAALEAGASIVNDVSAGRDDPELLELVAERGAGLVLMHMRGTPRDMQAAPEYADVVREVVAHLRERAHAAWKAGVEPSRIALDPGLGFGKRLEHNLELMRALPELRSLGFPLCLGASRKSFLGRLSGEPEPARRGAETTAAVALGAYLGAEIHRVHEVAPARAALALATALSAPSGGAP